MVKNSSTENHVQICGARERLNTAKPLMIMHIRQERCSIRLPGRHASRNLNVVPEKANYYGKLQNSTGDAPAVCFISRNEAKTLASDFSHRVYLMTKDIPFLTLIHAY
jgi:hypothetical protein